MSRVSTYLQERKNKAGKISVVQVSEHDRADGSGGGKTGVLDREATKRRRGQVADGGAQLAADAPPTRQHVPTGLAVVSNETGATPSAVRSGQAFFQTGEGAHGDDGVLEVGKKRYAAAFSFEGIASKENGETAMMATNVFVTMEGVEEPPYVEMRKEAEAQVQQFVKSHGGTGFSNSTAQSSEAPTERSLQREACEEWTVSDEGAWERTAASPGGQGLTPCKPSNSSVVAVEYGY